MEYTEQELADLKYFWKEKYIRHCTECNGSGIINNKKCICTIRSYYNFRLEQNGFGRKYLLTNLEHSRIQNEISKYATNFLNYKNEGKGLLIFGKHNTGKTLSIHALAKYVSERIVDLDIKFFLYDDLVRWSNEDRTFNAIEKIIKKTDILVLDDLGNEIGLRTQARSSVSLLANILNNRERMGKINWITTTLSLQDISSLYSDNIIQIIKRNSLCICSNEV